MSLSAPILVVGARTTGLTLAVCLARQGIPLRILDKAEGIDPYVRASVVHSRSLEVFHDLGIAGEVTARGIRVTSMSHFVDGRREAHARFGEVDSPFRWAVSIGQPQTEAILEEHLGALGVRVERGTELVDLTQDENHVHATIGHADGRMEQVDTPWLVGCDGAHSKVRHLEREGFPGEADPHQYLIADVIVEGDFPRGDMCSYVSDKGVVFFFPLPDGRSLVAADIAAHHDGPVEMPELEEVQAVVDERGPPGLRLSDPRWKSYFRIHYRLAGHYRHGRTFLAGDAAHVHSLIGGQGMNTGIQDAYNLAWKLGLVTQGRAPQSLLDSYEIERRAVARDVLDVTRATTERFVDWSRFSEKDRRRVRASMIVPEAMRLAAAQHREALDLDYRCSPACDEDVAPGHAAGPHAGAQIPDAGPLECDGETLTLFDVLRGPRHVLLLFPGPHGGPVIGDPSPLFADGPAGVLPDSWQDLVDVYVVATPGTSTPAPVGARTLLDGAGALAGRFGVDASALYLVRPDGHVGYRSRPADAAGLRRYLGQTFGSTT